MELDSYVNDAVQIALNWQLPDEALPEAVATQLALMAHRDPEEIPELYSG